MKGIGKIVGFPVKLSYNNRIYIPKEYLRFYGISEKRDKLLISKSEHSLFYRPISKDGSIYLKKETPAVLVGLTTLPIDWVRNNDLKFGDTLFLIGTTDGVLVYANK